MTKKMGVAEVKARLPEVVRGVAEEGQRVVIQRRGRPVAVIAPYDEAAEVSATAHWAEALDGIASGLGDFELIMKETVRSRRSAKPRAIDLEEGR
ncbi:MAG: type II toxin-antitoxin system Phd/YefM family antitoxin [Myxococcales bacterium]|nr:type II toxin-antitoxin system Phd/YefM family antitoxin [Myxococcales bacterium]